MKYFTLALLLALTTGCAVARGGGSRSQTVRNYGIHNVPPAQRVRVSRNGKIHGGTVPPNHATSANAAARAWKSIFFPH